MSDFSGGSVKTGFEQSSGRPVSLSVFDPKELDRIEDVISELLSEGASIRDAIEGIIQPEMMEFATRAVFRAFQLVSESPKPIVEINRIKWVFGSSMMDGVSVSDLGHEAGCSKQAIQQGAAIYREVFGPVRSQSRRTEKARELMRHRNVRNVKKLPVWEKTA